MQEDEFWDTTPAMFKYRQDGFSEDFRNGWEQTRFIAYIMAKTVDSKSKIKKPSDILPFAWDGGGKKRKSNLKTKAQMTDAEREEFEQFDREADEELKRINPDMYAKYMEAKIKAEQDGSYIT